jgi:hypothetical protein
MLAGHRGLIPFSATPVATLRACWDDLLTGKVEDGVDRQREETKRVDAAMADASHETWKPGYNRDGWNFFGRDCWNQSPMGGEIFLPPLVSEITKR